MSGLVPVSLDAQIDEVQRECERRRDVYGRLARHGQMNQRSAWRRIDVMAAVLDTLRNLRALQEIDRA
jgi:hypothetical protein